MAHYMDAAVLADRSLGGVVSQVPVDRYVGAPILTTPGAIQAAFLQADAILVLVDNTWDGNLDPSPPRDALQ